jgi:hypothetical protein
MSKYFSTPVKHFTFTLAKVDSNSDKIDFSNIDDKNFYHYTVNETKNDKSDVNFEIKKYNNKLLYFNDFKKKINKKIKNKKSEEDQSGGKKHSKKYDKDDDSSDDDYYIKKNKYYVEPLMSWWYNPLVYNTPKMYMPTFVSPLSLSYVLDFSPYYTILNNNNVINLST